MKPICIISKVVGVFVLALVIFLQIKLILISETIFYSIEKFKLEQGQQDQVESEVTHYLKINPHDAKAHEVLAKTYMKFDDYKAALDEAEVSYKLDKNNLQVYRIKSYSKSKLGDFEGAIDECNEGLKRFPGNSILLNNRAYISNLAGHDLNQSLADINLALETSQHPFYFHTKAEILRKLNRPHEGIQAAQEAINMDNNASYAYYEKGMSQIKIGKKKEGIKNIKKCIRLAKVDGNEEYLTKCTETLYGK